MLSYQYYADQEGLKQSTRWHFMNGTTLRQRRLPEHLVQPLNFERLDERLHAREASTSRSATIPSASGELSFNSNPTRRVFYTLSWSPQDFYDGDPHRLAA